MTKPPPSNDSIAILLALYNGAANLGEQLASFLDQSHTDWRLIVSDDGSTDAGPDMVRAFDAAQPDHAVELRDGPCQGYAQNFLSLLHAAGPDVPYAALSDQDDVWLGDKLARSIAALQAIPSDRPALYCSRTEICGEQLQPMGLSPLFVRPPSFANALVQNIAGGNTMVLNRAGLSLVQAASREMPTIVSHDWWIYQIITGAGGVVIYDPEPTLQYRQHEDNLIGANNSTRARMVRVRMMLSGRFRAWNDVNTLALSHVATLLSPQNRARLEAFAQARHKGLLARLLGLRKSGIYRQTRKGNIALLVAALTNRV
jgi:glycosyltransferase involved in cell wall biosynthesis